MKPIFLRCRAVRQKCLTIFADALTLGFRSDISSLITLRSLILPGVPSESHLYTVSKEYT